MPTPDRSPLVAAATAFDDELAIYARLGELFLKTPLTSLKHLERANHTLGELAECESRLQVAGQRLLEALAGARQHQEQLASAVVAHAPSVQTRNAELKDVMTAMAELAAEASAINAQVAQRNGADGSSRPDPGDVSAQVLSLAERAEQLAARSRTAELEELASQAHALHQRLLAIATKLKKATGN